MQGRGMRRHRTHRAKRQQAFALFEGHHSCWHVSQQEPAINRCLPLCVEHLLELAAVDVRFMLLYERELLSHRANDWHESPPLCVRHPLNVSHEMPTGGCSPAAAVHADLVKSTELPQILCELPIQTESYIESAAILQICRALDHIYTPIRRLEAYGHAEQIGGPSSGPCLFRAARLLGPSSGPCLWVHGA